VVAVKGGVMTGNKKTLASFVVGPTYGWRQKMTVCYKATKVWYPATAVGFSPVMTRSCAENTKN
jgi:hypothetical protein